MSSPNPESRCGLCGGKKLMLIASSDSFDSVGRPVVQRPRYKPCPLCNRGGATPVPPDGVAGNAGLSGREMTFNDLVSRATKTFADATDKAIAELLAAGIARDRITIGHHPDGSVTVEVDGTPRVKITHEFKNERGEPFDDYSRSAGSIPSRGHYF